MSVPQGYNMRGRYLRRLARQDPGTPDTEIPKHRSYRKTKKKHVHEYKTTLLNTRRKTHHFQGLNGKWYSIEVPVYDWLYFCEGCGHRTTRRGW